MKLLFIIEKLGSVNPYELQKSLGCTLLELIEEASPLIEKGSLIEEVTSNGYKRWVAKETEKGDRAELVKAMIDGPITSKGLYTKQLISVGLSRNMVTALVNQWVSEGYLEEVGSKGSGRAKSVVYGLAGSQSLVEETLLELLKEGPFTMTALAGETGIDKKVIEKCLTRLSVDGKVTRKRSVWIRND